MLERNRCPITGTAQVETLLDVPFESGLLREWAAERNWLARLRGYHLRILHNATIDFYFQGCVFDEQEEQHRRQRMAERHPPTRDLSLTELAHKAEDAILVRLLHPSETPRVFDYGMGDCRWARMAAAYGAEVCGSDIDPRTERLAAKWGLGFAQMNALPEKHFDFINADQVFEHLAEPGTVIRKLAAALRPGGHLKISTPGDTDIRKKINLLSEGRYTLDGFKTDFSSLAPLSHINLFNAASLQALAENAGLRQFRVPLRLCYSAAAGFHSARQLNRNVSNPWKRHRARGTWQFFVKG